MVPQWGELPHLVLTEIYAGLTTQDRLNASFVCLSWRQALFQPRFFKQVTFEVSRENEPKNRFLLNDISHLTECVTLVFDPQSLFGVQKATQILQKVSTSNCVKYLRLRPLHSSLVVPLTFGSYDFVEQFFVKPLTELLSRRHRALIELDVGCAEFMVLPALDMLDIINKPKKVESLSLASVKSDPSYYFMKPLTSAALAPFCGLHKLSIDFEHVTDDLLGRLETIPTLRALVVHVHGCLHFDDRTVVSDDAWTALAAKNKSLELHLTLIYAYEAVQVLHSHILSAHMPLSHLKVLFCEYLNTSALEFLSKFKRTLKSVVWVDLTSDVLDWNNNEADEMGQESLVMMAWRCKQLEELILHGHPMDAYDMVGIARLRGSQLKRFEVSELEWSTELNEEIGQQLEQPGWTPLPESKFNNIFVRNGNVKESLQDQYIMDVVQADFETSA